MTSTLDHSVLRTIADHITKSMPLGRFPESIVIVAATRGPKSMTLGTIARIDTPPPGASDTALMAEVEKVQRFLARQNDQFGHILYFGLPGPDRDPRLLMADIMDVKFTAYMVGCEPIIGTVILQDGALLTADDQIIPAPRRDTLDDDPAEHWSTIVDVDQFARPHEWPGEWVKGDLPATITVREAMATLQVTPGEAATITDALTRIAWRDGLIAWACIPDSDLPPDLESFDQLGETYVSVALMNRPDQAKLVTTVRLLAAVAQATPPRMAGHVFTTMAYLAWLDGDGAGSRTWLEHASGDGPLDQLGRLTQGALTLPPPWHHAANPERVNAARYEADAAMFRRLMGDVE